MIGKVARGLAILAGILILAVGGLAGFVYSKSQAALDKTYSIKLKPAPIPEGKDAAEKGRHLVETIGCGHCHADDMGGKVFLDDPMMGKAVPPNITGGKGSRTGKLTDEQWVLAIRHGVGPDGKPLKFMPCQVFYNINDTGLAAMIAYYKTIPKVDRELPPTQFGPLARALYVMGQLPLFATAELIDHSLPRPEEIPPGVTKEYGKYLNLTGGCEDCHGPGLSGGKVPGTPPNDPDFPPATNITPAGIGKWTEEDFFRAMREGNRPDQTGIHPFMPWEYTAKYTDEELKALWLFLKSVPPREKGNR
jgi:mono/diheme cytochrome c family protein